MSTLASIISQVNSVTGYLIPTSSQIIISASSAPGSGSVNTLVDYVNSLTGYSIPYTSASVVSGSISSAPIVVYQQTPTSGTIPTSGIYPGAIIEAEHLLRIINALNGINPNLIILSGSLYVSGSATMAQNLNLPFAPDQNVLLSQTGSVSGSGDLDGGSF